MASGAMASGYIERRRAAAMAYGITLREKLLGRFMRKYGYTERPFLKDVVDDLIEDEDGLYARLREEPLPLDRYAQSEVVGGRIVVSINSRVAEMPNVKHADGVVYVGKWHEAVHVDGHLQVGEGAVADEPQQLPLFDATRSRLIVCRGAGWQTHENPEWELTAENGGLAAAIAAADLLRCDSFLDLLDRIKRQSDLGGYGLRLLYDTASRIGVNPPALIRYLGRRGLCRLVRDDAGARLVADPKLFEDPLWLEVETRLANPITDA
jgi:hypothetical protein